ncbi:MAG TPA: enolase C-terminal domain-like protein [Candidatus Limnocylindrales bacterium]|nr:enolase C-terminal domain-like protein [Candidatus Limnocylindrales bacterium]
MNIGVALVKVELRPFCVPAPAPPSHHSAVRGDARGDDVRGWLVGLTDGKTWGWWGPVPQSVAAPAPDLLSAAFPALPAEVDLAGFARCLRRATRHAHTGLLALTVGSLELAAWDLAAKRAGLPVWALIAPHAGRDARVAKVPAYATCFGVGGPGRYPTRERVAGVMDELAETFAVQKWRPVVLDPHLLGVTTGFAERQGGGRVAVDFLGTWKPERVREVCTPLADVLAWAEEPYHPDEVHLGRRGEFGAPHAAGEHCYGPADTAQLLSGEVDIWQPDAVFCGGWVNLAHLVRAAAAAGAICAPHGGGFLPALHLAALGEPIAMVELHLLLEPRRCAHLAEPPRLDTAELAVPQAPGWGGELRRDLADG